MAARFWVGGSGTWDSSTTTHWAASSGGVGGQSAPSSTDDVTFDSLSNATAYTVTTSGNPSCANLTMGAPLVGKITFAGSTAVELDIYGNLNMAGGTAGITWTANIDMFFIAPSGTQVITSNGVTFSISNTSGGIHFGSGNTSQIVQLADNFSFSGRRDFRLHAGTTFDPNGKTVTLTGLGTTLMFMRGNFTFFNLTYTSTGAVLDINDNIVVTNALSLNGTAVGTGRALIESDRSGIQTTITAASVSASYVDFQDIKGAGAGNWDLSAITGFSGDCGGNSGITFTPSVMQTSTGTASFNWSTHGWTTRVPLPQDDVSVPNAFVAGRTITIGTGIRIGRNVTFSCTGSPTVSNGTISVFGSLNLTGVGSVTGNGITFSGRTASTLKTSTAVLGVNVGIIIETLNGSITLSDDCKTGNGLSVDFGTLNLNGKRFTGTSASFGGSVFGVPDVSNVIFNGGIIECNFTLAATVWSTSPGGAFDTSNGGTIQISGSTTNARTFAGGGYSYPRLLFTNATANGTLIISGSSSFTSIECLATNKQTIKFTAGTTTSTSGFKVTGVPSNLITITSTSTATFALKKTNGIKVSSDYLNISHSVATPANVWFAGEHSVNNQATVTAGSGWIFSVPIPTVASRDENYVPTLLSASSEDGSTIVAVALNRARNNALSVENGTVGSNFGSSVAARDQNMIPVLMAVSDADGVTPIEIYADSATGALLIQST